MFDGTLKFDKKGAVTFNLLDEEDNVQNENDIKQNVTLPLEDT